MSDNCLNCGHAKAEHSKYDVLCLRMSGWSEAELGLAETCAVDNVPAAQPMCKEGDLR